MNVKYWANWLQENYPEAKRLVANANGRAVELRILPGGDTESFCYVENGKLVPSCSAEELVAELEPGTAIAVIERSRPHFHLKTTERYTAIQGALVLIVDGKLDTVVSMDWGALPDSAKNIHSTGRLIDPMEVHHAVSIGAEPAVVEVCSNPPWSPKDHFEV